METTELPADLINLDLYPVTNLDSPAARSVIERQRRSLAEKGVAILPDFVRAESVRRMVDQAMELRPKAYLEDVWGTPYLSVADESFPEGHPRRALVRSLTWVIAYDLIPRGSLLRSLYEWDPLKDFVGEILERRPLYRMADPLGALNIAIMDAEHTQGWHYDNTEFVVSLALQSSRDGGKFECASMIRSADNENYEAVARVLRSDGSERVEILPMTPGTLMIFAGRNSLHRVSPVEGEVPRVVALLAYDTRPDSDSSELFKLVRYGRSAPLNA
jgi:hypothetical protein